MSFSRSSSDTPVAIGKEDGATEVASNQHNGYQWTALSVTTVGALLASIQGSALLIALPNILTELQATFLTIMWVLIGYLLITTVLTPVIGRLADIWGRKQLYNSGFMMFALGSLVAGLAQPQFHGGDLIVGFLFNVPVAIFGAIWGLWRLREPVRLAKRQHIDFIGAITLTIGLTGTLLALSLLAFPLLSQTITYTILALGIVGLVLFGVIEPRIKEPLVQLRLFRDRLFLFANLSGLLNGIARGAVLFLLIFFLQGPYGQDPLRAGLMLAPFGAAFMIVGPLSGRLSDRAGSRVLAPVGLGISALGLLGLSTVGPSTPYWLLSIFMALMGGGSGFFVSPNTNAIMSSVPAQMRGAAAGILSMLNNTGQMLSIAIVFPLALSAVPMVAMMHVFIYGGGMSQFPAALNTFLHGVHLAFLVSFALSVIAMIVAVLRPSHR